jgi:hypothetical protein
VESDITDESTAVVCQLLMHAVQVNPDARPTFLSLIEVLMDNHIPQEHWGTILFRVWQQLREESSA